MGVDLLMRARREAKFGVLRAIRLLIGQQLAGPNFGFFIALLLNAQNVSFTSYFL